MSSKMRAKLVLDEKIRRLIEMNAKANHRSLFVVLKGDKQCVEGSVTPEALCNESVMILHHLLSKSIGGRPSILWCHKKDANVPRQSQKKLKKFQKDLKSGKCDVSDKNAFDVFLLSTSIKYCSFGETHKVLGNTYGMCVIQDFEGLTPNVLCCITETVGGGGVVIFLLPLLTSLEELGNVHMDTHGKLKTHSHPDVCHYFNKRYVQSLKWCDSCIVMDCNLKLLFDKCNTIIRVIPDGNEATAEQLVELQNSLADAEKPLPQLIQCCRTFDQGRVLLKFIDTLTERSSRTTVSLTAGRGRGKSATLGLAVSAAVHFGLNNIFVTSPTPDTLGTFFQFVLKGFDALGYQDGTDYQIHQSLNEEFNHAIVTIIVFREHRQIIQYIDPSDVKKVIHAELMVIDEAAAIPLMHVRSLMVTQCVFMASTVNGYEGTGRSLSLKLLQQMRKDSCAPGAMASKSTEMAVDSYRNLHEEFLDESIRYANGDPVESWLYRLMCLDASSLCTPLTSCPPPQMCQLYFVNREVLFSGHPESEHFLQQAMSLLVASHYRNSPDDLQVLADAPAHHLFVLLPPIVGKMDCLPSVLVVIQVSLEGSIPTAISSGCQSRGERPSGDLVPWTLASQFLNAKLTQYTGLRIVRVATHSDYQSMGYGSCAMSLLWDYYCGKLVTLDENLPVDVKLTQHIDEDETPLLSKLNERLPEPVNYLSVSYGVTLLLLKFWAKAGFIPFYISQVNSKITGEHNCMMVKSLDEELPPWMKKILKEFLRRFVTLLGGPLADLPAQLSQNVLKAHSNVIKPKDIPWSELKHLISGHDLVRLEKYCKNLADRHLVWDLVPYLAQLYFMRRLSNTHLSSLQESLLVGTGLQLHDLDQVSSQTNLPIESAMGQFNRAVRRILSTLQGVQESAFAMNLGPNLPKRTDFVPVDLSLDQDLDEAAKEYEISTRLQSAIYGDVTKFAIGGDEEAWNDALQTGTSQVISVKSKKRRAQMSEAELERELNGPSGKVSKMKGPKPKQKDKWAKKK